MELTPSATAGNSAVPVDSARGEGQAPHPGSRVMPRWDLGELPPPPRFTAKSWALLIGPGLVTGGAAIGGGEWLLGPLVAARYGGALLWLTTLSILGQVVYNLEISRYTLYTGESIFVGKFRIPPGPRFWLWTYLALDFGSIFPYLAANAATPLAAAFLGRIPLEDGTFSFAGASWTDRSLVQALRYVCFVVAIIPLTVGGKVYRSLKVVMATKIVVVFGFLGFLAFFYSNAATWREIGAGFVSFGTVPAERGEDANGNGHLDEAEDWDGDGRLDGVEPKLQPTVDTNGDGVAEAWADVNGDGRPDRYRDEDRDGHRDGENVDNVFAAWWAGRSMPTVDLTMIGFLAALAAVAGNGGLTSANVSAYTRDQGWGMGSLVGAVPSLVGGRHIKLSHVGMVFPITPQSLERFRGWFRHVVRDQLVVWTPACFIGIALPSMLSIQFLPRGTEASDWSTAAMTADAVASSVGGGVGAFCWFMTLFCGFLVLAPSGAAAADGFLRRWVDVFWTGSVRLRKLEPERIRQVYFGVLCAYTAFGLFALSLAPPRQLILWATVLYNYVLGVSCWHTVAVNVVLLPRELRPGWGMRIGLVLTGLFFTALALITTINTLGLM
jgi:hypothetical protein